MKTTGVEMCGDLVREIYGLISISDILDAQVASQISSITDAPVAHHFLSHLHSNIHEGEFLILEMSVRTSKICDALWFVENRAQIVDLLLFWNLTPQEPTPKKQAKIAEYLSTLA
jgi:hypothetical protein